MIVLDTHVLIWLDEGNERLGKRARKIIDKALSQEKLAVAAISFWEAAMLEQRGRVEFRIDIDVWRKDLLANGLIEIPLSGSAAIKAGKFVEFYGDPADRIITATALEHSASLLTADEKLLGMKRLVTTIDARK